MEYSEETLRLVVGLNTSHAIWEALKNAYAQDSQEREFTLQQQVTYLRKEDNTTIIEHIRTFKGLCDNFSAIGKPVPDQEKVFCLLRSLAPHYETFTTTMLKPPRPSYSKLVSQLQTLIKGTTGSLTTQTSQLLLSFIKWLFMDSSNNAHSRTLHAIMDLHKSSPPMDMNSRLNSKWTLLQQTHNINLHHLVSVA